ncbi:hypothetical protein ACMZ8M_03455 [Gardnerella pickettii]|uniref:hypothetical protein n=1 Tax=Gardnerella pickettii TaxID=2914924 RepID=UPI0039EFD6EA
MQFQAQSKRNRTADLRNASYRSRGLSARTSSLALKAHCAFNFEQAQRIEVYRSRVTARSRPRLR